MADVSLSLPERSALLALMSFVKEASNTDIHARYGFTIDKKVRDRLLDLRFITAHKSRELRGAFVHELTEEGWQHGREELAAEVPKGAQKAYRLLYGIMHVFEAHMTRARLTVADVFVPGSAPEIPQAAVDAAGRIRSAYDSLAARPGAWVSLTRLRDALAPLSRDEIDEALLKLDLQPRTYLIPEANQKTLPAADREAAIHIGGEDKHLLSIERA
jgi:hypothetical protein